MRRERLLPPCFSDAMQLRCSRGLETSSRTLHQLVLCSEREHVFVVRSELGDNIGYLAYAMIDECTLAELARAPDLFLRGYEHSEGEICFVLEVVVLPTRFREFLRAFLRRRWRPTQVAYFRHGQLVHRRRRAHALGNISSLPPASLVIPVGAPARGESVVV